MEIPKYLTEAWKFINTTSVYGSSLALILLWIAISLVFFILLIPLVRFIDSRLRAFASKSNTSLDDAVHEYLEITSNLFLFTTSLYIAQQIIPLSSKLNENIESIALLGALLQAGLWLQVALSHTLKRVLARSDLHSAHSLLNTIGRCILWSFVFLLVLSNFGVDVSALLTGLGIGGIAIALAVQTVLGDLLSSLSIVLDKPFEVGDFIITGDIMGVVERIGLKTTRIRSLSGEQWVLANSDLVGSRVRNFKRMNERRVVLKVGVTYDTDYEQVKQIPSMIKEIIDAQDKVRYDRVHFSEFAPASLDYEIVFYMLVADYNQFMDTKQAINLAILQKFRDAGIEFAFPTQTLHIHRAGEEKQIENSDNAKT